MLACTDSNRWPSCMRNPRERRRLFLRATYAPGNAQKKEDTADLPDGYEAQKRLPNTRFQRCCAIFTAATIEATTEISIARPDPAACVQSNGVFASAARNKNS